MTRNAAISARLAAESRRQASILYTLLTVAFLIFLLYASFFGAAGHYPPKPGIVQNILAGNWRALLPKVTNLRDFAVNILLYIPFGAIIAARLACRTSARVFRPALLLGLVVSLLIEAVQGYVGRYSDTVDVITNTTGFGFGFVTMTIAVRYFGLRPAHLIGLDERTSGNARLALLNGVRFLYVSIFMVASLVPFDIITSGSRIFAKLSAPVGKEPQIILNPAQHFFDGIHDLDNLLVAGAAFVPVAILSYWISILRGVRPGISPFLHCLILAIATQTAEVFLASGHSDVSVLWISQIAALLAVLFSRAFMQSGAQQGGSQPITTRNLPWMWMLLCYVVIVALLAWAPFRFEINADLVFHKIRTQTNWLPFRNHFNGASVGAAIDIVREFLLMVPFGLLFGGLLASHHRRRARDGAIIAVTAFTIGLFLEISQTMIAGRYADITDALLGTAGATAGWLVFNVLSPKPATNS